MTAHPAETAEVEHVLDTSARPAACSCGKARFAGSPTFVRTRHALHVAEATTGGVS